MDRTSKTRSLNHRAAIAAIFGTAGMLLAAQAFAQAQGPAAPPPNAVAVIPAGETSPAARPEAVVPTVVVSGEGTVVATVNDEPITQHDVDERLALDLALMGTRPTDEDKARLRVQELKKLEAEVLHIQEAHRKQIGASIPEVEQKIAAFAQSLNKTPAELQAALAGVGVNLDALRREISADIAWGKSVADEYQERAASSISPADVDAEIARIAEGANKPRFHVREIVLAVDNPADDAKVKSEAQTIINQIKQGASLPAVVRSWSQNPSAASDGDIGWVREGQYAPELIKALSDMKVNSLTEAPIKANGAYYILYLQERQEAVGTQIAASPTLAESKQTQLPLVRILLPLGAKPTKEYIDGAMQAAADLRFNRPPCGTALKDGITKMNGVYQDLNTFQLADLSPEIQKALAPTRSGEAAEPILSPAGVELIVRCDPPQEVLTPFVMPSREDVENQIYTDRITTWARRYERDLRRSADIADVKPR